MTDHRRSSGKFFLSAKFFENILIVFYVKVLRLLNEPSAAAVAYGLYRTSTDLPNAEQPVMSLSLILVLRLCRLLFQHSTKAK